MLVRLHNLGKRIDDAVEGMADDKAAVATLERELEVRGGGSSAD